jgi:hypothetical protein
MTHSAPDYQKAPGANTLNFRFLPGLWRSAMGGIAMCSTANAPREMSEWVTNRRADHWLP